MTSRLEERAARREGWDLPVGQVRFAERHTKALERLGIRTVGDLLMHLPFRYVDLSQVVEIAQVREGQQVTVSGVVRGVRASRPRPKLSVVSVALFDGSGYLFGTWYNQAYVADRLTEGVRAVFSGTVRRAQGRLEMNAPFFEVLEGEEGAPVPEAHAIAPATGVPAAAGTPGRAHPKGPHAARIIPIYPATAGLSATWLRRLAYEALKVWGDIPDPLPAGLRLRRGLPPAAWSLAQAHFPDDETSAALATRRLAYDELFYLQVGLAARRRFLHDEVKGISCGWPSDLVKRYVAALPWPLTGDQERAVDDVGGDMARPHPMNRLLYGEVGSGKTVVAAAGLLTAVAAGAQAAMMAPTEVLAEQYAKRIGPDLDALGVPWARLVGSTPAAQKKSIRARLAGGEIKVVFGTHALIEGAVAFARLGLAVVDEQHRFGVRQRMALAVKGGGGADTGGKGAPGRGRAGRARTGADTTVPAPHVLVMSATPIPRTLAMTLYGDLDVSVLRERPSGAVGAQVTTRVLDRRHRSRAYDLVRKEVKAGHQAFIVCPIIDPSDKIEVRSVTREMDRLKDKEFWGIRLGVLHGKMTPDEKEAAMGRFAAGELDVLVATTVIEVGIDVPNATVMIVEDAERFGLAQLHQLRGRVGRGEAPAWCLLFADPTTESGKARMEAIERSSDGFELAELDLEIRGPGEILGARQSGLPPLNVARLDRDVEVLSWAREDALALVEKDPRLAEPLHAALAREVVSRYSVQLDWLRA